MSAFEDFVNLELPKRPPMLTLANTGFDGDPVTDAPPAVITNAPAGTFFLRNTGFNLYKKNSSTPSAWERIAGQAGVFTTTDLTVYIATTGSDSNDGLTPGTPLLTIAAALAKFTKGVSADLTIKFAAGTYSEMVSDARDFVINAATGKAGLLFEGAFSDFIPTTGPATGTFDASFGTPTIEHTAKVTGATWTVDNLTGQFVELTSGPNIGVRLPIANNMADTLDMGGPADQTAAGGVDLRSQTFKFVQPTVIFQHPLTSTNAMFILGGTTNQGAPSSVVTAIKNRRSYGFYGIKFLATTASRGLVQGVGGDCRVEACVIEQQSVASFASANSVASGKAGTRFGVCACYFTHVANSTTQVIHISMGSGVTAGSLSTSFSVFDKGNLGVFGGINSSTVITSCLVQGQRTYGWNITGGSGSSTGGIVFRNINLSSFSTGLSFGSQPNTSAFLFVSQPTPGAAKILNCSIGIFAFGPSSFSQTPIRNLIIDGCGTGVWISAPYNQFQFQSCSIINSTGFGVRVGGGPFTTPPAFYAGFDFAPGGVTMTGNVSGDFTFDGVTTYTQAFISGLPDKLLIDARGNFILGV